MLDSGFQSPGFRIPEAKNSRIPESGFPYMGRSGGFICDFNRFSAAQRLLKKVIVTESVAPLDDKMPAVDVVGNDEGENRVVRRLDQISLFRCITLRI